MALLLSENQSLPIGTEGDETNHLNGDFPVDNDRREEKTAPANYVLEQGPTFHPADEPINPPVRYTATGKYSVYSPPHGDFYPFTNNRFYSPVE